MRVKPELAAAVLFAAVGVSLAVGALAGVAITQRATPAPERAPACLCAPETIRT